MDLLAWMSRKCTLNFCVSKCQQHIQMMSLYTFLFDFRNNSFSVSEEIQFGQGTAKKKQMAWLRTRFAFVNPSSPHLVVSCPLPPISSPYISPTNLVGKYEHGFCVHTAWYVEGFKSVRFPSSFLLFSVASSSQQLFFLFDNCRLNKVSTKQISTLRQR